MNTPQRVLFPVQRTHYDHGETVRMLLDGKPIPEGGPFCICSPKAICALKAGAPVPCADLPWKCPFNQPQPETPSV